MKYLLILTCFIFGINGISAQIDSVFYHYGNGDTAKYYILDDGFVFKYQDNVIFDDATILNSPIVKILSR